jgi:hypothetical protein
MNHRDIATTRGFVSRPPRRPNFRLRLNVKRLCVIKLRVASSGKNRAEHCWHIAPGIGRHTNCTTETEHPSHRSITGRLRFPHLSLLGAVL